MKKLYLPLLAFSIISCNENNNIKTVSLNASTEMQTKQETDSVKWIDSFREFRNAVYQKDKEKVKRFIDFPIMNENNEIWYLAYGEDDKRLSKMSNKIKPFTEKDLDLYFDKLFSNRFINTILKIKSEELFTKGEYETKGFEDNNTNYRMYATFDKTERTLNLNLSSKIEDVEDGGEFSINYEFDVLKNGQIKFRQVRLAG